MDFTSEIGDHIGNAYANQTVKPQQIDPILNMKTTNCADLRLNDIFFIGKACGFDFRSKNICCRISVDFRQTKTNFWK